MKNRKGLKIIGGYSCLLGLSVIAMWIQIILNESIPEGKTEITFHLVSEFLMALLCIVSGIMLIKEKLKGKITNVAAHAMMLYSLINAAGYYAEKGENSLVAIFIILAILSLLIIFFQIIPLK